VADRLGPGDQCSVTSNFIVLDGLSGPDNRSIKDPFVGNLTHEVISLANKTIDRGAFNALRLLRRPQGITGGQDKDATAAALSIRGIGCSAQLPEFGRLAYPMRGEVTNRAVLGRKRHGLQRGKGAIIRAGRHKIAAYRDENGQLNRVSAACTHVGCHVRWNSFERCWDCPCHGSHFAIDGTALNGPAVSSLPPAAGNHKE
jgi:Rieske Fe-S protein